MPPSAARAVVIEWPPRTWRSPLDDLLDALASSGVAVLPDVGPLALAAVHAVYEAWIARYPPWLPLLVLDGRHAGTSERVHQADLRAFVYAGPGVPRTNLAAAVARRGGVLLVQGAEPGSPFGALRIAAEVDPSTARQRQVLAAWMAGGEPALLTGSVGTGRASLARAAVPGVDVIGDVEELPPGALAALLPRLEPPLVRRGGPRGEPPAGAPPDLVGKDARFCAMLQSAADLAPRPVPVLILGETGTGKEPLARFLHEASGRRGPFVPVDLSARSALLVADDLFGHMPGAYNDARTSREGALRQAHRGTLFIDELGNLTPELQQKLLRFLDDGLVQPLGSDARHPVDVRVIAATNADIDGMVREGSFRADLYHRLAAAILRPPPLRERGDDVILLAEHFAAALGRRLEPGAGAALMARSFPGNVRELRGLIGATAALGRLSADALTEVRRPLAVTSTGDLSSLPRRLALRLSALNLAVAPPAERGPECLRNAIAFGLAGRPVTRAAIEALQAAPWWGNFHEVDRKLAALQASPAGVIDAADIGRLFPLSVRAREPIVAVLHPESRRSDGGVTGFIQTFAAGALIVGRARTRADLGSRAAWVESQARDTELGFVSLPSPAMLSRVQALVLRDGDGLRVEAAPDTQLSVDAERIDDRGWLLRVLNGDEPVVTLAVLLGDDWMARLGQRLEPAPARVNDTLRGGKRAWRVSDAEHAFLVAFFSQFYTSNRDFTSVLREMFEGRPDLVELRGYLLSANVPQSTGRLLRPANPDLVAALRREILDRGLDPSRLPAQVRGALGLE